jgi:hypothetical protein
VFFGVTAGNMDSMINRYTADRKIRSDDAYTPGDVGGSRPDRCTIVYSQRCKEAWNDVPIVLGGIEGSLRRIAHYDYWQTRSAARSWSIRSATSCCTAMPSAPSSRSPIASRRASRCTRSTTCATAYVRRETPEGWFEIDSTSVDEPGRVEAHVNPYLMVSDQAKANGAS